MLPPEKSSDRCLTRVEFIAGHLRCLRSLSEGQKIRGADFIPNSASQTLVKFAINLAVNRAAVNSLVLLFATAAALSSKTIVAS